MMLQFQTDTSSRKGSARGKRTTKTRLPAFGKSSADAGAGDLGLMSAMTVRLTQAETKLRDANSKNAAQAAEIKQLRERIGAFELDRTARKQAEGAGAGAIPGTHDRRYARMQAKIHEMETFLADYGMIWVGGDDDDDYSNTESDDTATATVADEATTAAAPQATWAPGASVPAEPAVPEIQYTKIIKNVEDLNQLAGEGVGHVVRRADGSSHIKMPDPVALRLYRNGVMMFDGPFRTFETEATQRLIRDLTDGYFPGEFQERYPDGIPFKVYDMRAEDYVPPRAGTHFPGRANVLGGAVQQPKEARSASTSVPAQLVQPSTIRTLSDRDAGAVPTTSADALLNRLPKNVIRNGRVIDVRGGIAEMLQAGGNKVSVVRTEVLTQIQDNAAKLDGAASASGEARPQTPQDIATLQVKSENGKDTFVLKLRSGDTVATVRHYLDKQRPLGTGGYKLVSAYPRKELTDDMTLEDAGLTPRATIRMIANKR